MVLIIGFLPETVALGIFAVVLVIRNLIFNIFPFPVSTAAHLVGEFLNNRRSGTNNVALIILAPCVIRI
jgi:hypothetical protein